MKKFILAATILCCSTAVFAAPAKDSAKKQEYAKLISLAAKVAENNKFELAEMAVIVENNIPADLKRKLYKYANEAFKYMEKNMK